MEDYLTTEDVAKELGVSTSRVRQIILSGKLVAKREGDRYRGCWKIAPEDVENYKLNRKKRGRPHE